MSNVLALGLIAIAILAAIFIVALGWKWRNRRQVTVEAAEAGVAPLAVEAPHAPASPEGPATTEVAPEDPGIRALESPEIFAKLYQLALGAMAALPVTLNTEHQSIAAATIEALTDAATQERYTPRRPNLLPRLLQAVGDDRVSGRELAAIIARDPSLVGNLLKMANSAFYRVTPQPVESVDRAVVLLGTEGIRSLIAASLMQPIFRVGATAFPKFPEIAWEHAIRSASAAVPHAALAEKTDPFACELLCLVMGLAGIVIFRVAVDHYAAQPRLRPDAGLIAQLIDAESASVARLIATSWDLSERSLEALDGQTAAAASHSTALGRSLRYGRIAGALAVLRINSALDADTARASLPAAGLSDTQVERIWTRLTAKPTRH